MRIFIRLLLYFTRFFEEIVASMVFIAIVASQSLQIFFRYVLQNPLIGTEEITQILFVWLGFIGSVVVTKHVGHLSIDLITSAMTASIKKLFEWFIRVVIICFLVVIVEEGIRLFILTKGIGTPALNISLGVMYIPVPIFGILTLVRMLSRSDLIKSKSLIEFINRRLG